ncbi:PIH1 domain-containing protein 2-like [Lineus longissimus]|uniref:PIH1 domain-containing protein 2-like n=1 Tax=Lineus longissimus TaxID=88925 RepID=UPI002B4CC3D1
MEGLSQENMMAKAQQIWTMLDDMSENNPQAYRKFIDKQKQESKEWTTPPETHMCVQTVMYEPTRQRVFMNFCAWLRVHGPKDDEAPIPVVGGPLLEDEDDDGIYSVVSLGFNPKVLEEFGRDSKNPEELKAMVNLAISFVQDAHKVQLSRSYTILKRSIQCKGSEERTIKSLKSVFNKGDSETEKQIDDLKKSFAPMQAMASEDVIGNVKNSNGVTPNMDIPILTKPGASFEQPDPAIRISADSKPAKPGLIQEISDSKVVLPKPEYSVVVKDVEGDRPRCIVFRLELPGVTSVRDCDLDISEDDLTLCVTNKYEICLQFPEKVLDDKASAKFSTKSSCLTLTMPTVKKS